MGHVPQDPVRPEGQGADLQGRQRRGTAAPRDVAAGPPRRSLANQARGRWGEDEAARWYVAHGYVVQVRNWRCPQGELDLVVRQADTVVFCEVKARSNDAFGGAAAAVGWDKQRRLRRLAAAWLATNDVHGVEVRFDVAAVTGAHIEVIEAAF
ncbi:MAG: YraN family protein [Ilumatobacteraceae bacterium]